MNEQESRYRADESDAAEEHEPTPSGIAEDRPGAGFDPNRYVRQLRGRGGGQDYLDVRYRLAWLRRDHPDARIETDHVQLDDRSAIFRATVTLQSGGMATGYGSETASDFGDFIEKAETKAIGRALNALGYGMPVADGDDAASPERPTVTTASPNRPPPGRSRSNQRAETSAPSAPPPTAIAPPVPDEPADPFNLGPAPSAADVAAATGMQLGVRQDADAATASPTAPPAQADDESPTPRARGRRSRQAAEEPAAEPERSTTPERGSTAQPPTEDDPEDAGVRHDSFWNWAREHGLETRADVEAVIERPMSGLTPARVREMILERLHPDDADDE